MAPGSERAFWGAFVALALLVCWAIVSPEYLPMADWPQHAAQVSALHDLALGRCGYDAVYRINWLTPYWLGYGPATVLAFVLPVDAAMRVVLALGLLALPLAARMLIRELGGDGWWSLAAFAAAFGANFGWGFFNFLVAAPLALLLAGLTVRHLRRPSAGGAWALLATGLALFAGHAAAAACGFAFSGLLALVVGAEGGGMRRIVRHGWPLALPAGLAGAWLAVLSRWEPGTADALRAGAPAIVRWRELPRLLTGLVDARAAFAMLVLLFLTLALLRPRPSRSPLRWLPLALTLLAYSFAPNYLIGTAQVYPRLLVFLLPSLFLGFTSGAGSPTPSWRRLALPTAVAFVLLASALRFAAFSAESAGLREVLAAAPAGERLLYLPLQRESPLALEPVFLHAGAWYAVGRCGVSAVSFASAFTTPVRFRAEREPRLPLGLEWHADRLRWEGVSWQFDLFLVRSEAPVVDSVLFGAEDRVELVAHLGGWWLFLKPGALRSPASRAGPD